MVCDLNNCDRISFYEGTPEIEIQLKPDQQHTHHDHDDDDQHLDQMSEH